MSFFQLEQDLINNKAMVLVLGAGVNYNKGVKLLWHEIVSPLFIQALRQLGIMRNIDIDVLHVLEDIFDNGKQNMSTTQKQQEFESMRNKLLALYPLQVQVSIAKSVLKSQYLHKLRSYIYSQLNKDLIRDYFSRSYALSVNPGHDKGELYSLYTMARLALLYQSLKGVITYNYDNFLTHAIDILQESPDTYLTEDEQNLCKYRLSLYGKKRLQVKDVFGTRARNTLDGDSLPIFHPHGFLPPPSRTLDLSSSNIVMSVDEYSDNTMQTYSWVNDTQVHLLAHYSSIIFGTSISEITTQRMFYYARQNGCGQRMYYLNAVDQADNIEGKVVNAMDSIRNTYFSDYGLIPITDQGGFDSLCKRLNMAITAYVEIQKNTIIKNNPRYQWKKQKETETLR